MKVSEGLAKAAEVMAERGHTTGIYVDKTGVCAMGAIFIAGGADLTTVTVGDEVVGYSLDAGVPTYDGQVTLDLVRKFTDFLKANAERFGWPNDQFEGIPEWNDRSDYERVHTAFVEAAGWAKQFETE